MINTFEVCVSQLTKKVQGFSIRTTLTKSLQLHIRHQGPAKHVDTEQFFYFRFGAVLAEDAAVADEALLQLILKNNYEGCGALNLGYLLLFFFDKQSKKGCLMSDRIGIHNLYYQAKAGELRVSNNPEVFTFDEVLGVGDSWLKEVANFRNCTGPVTFRPHVKQVPAGQYCTFGSSLRPSKSHFYWQPKKRTPTPSLTLDAATSSSYNHIERHLVNANLHHKKTAVLLSGGVDSSLLAGLLHEQRAPMVAVTPVFKSWLNPELDAAKKMATAIGTEHQIVEISDDDVSKEFSGLVRLLGQPLRSSQTIVFSILMKRLKGEFDAVLFGEGADMMFGYHGVSTYSERYRKHCKLAPYRLALKCLSPFQGNKTIRKMIALVDEPVGQQVMNSWRIEYTDEVQQFLPKIDLKKDSIEILKWLELAELDRKSVSQLDFENLVRWFIIQESCYYHFATVGAIADRDGLELVCPFFDVEVAEFASRFDNKLYFGSEYTKPVLRKINERYYDDALIYGKKMGFPTPDNHWLEGPLSEFSGLAKEFISEHFGRESCKDKEFVWLVMAFQVLGIEGSLIEASATPDRH